MKSHFFIPYPGNKRQEVDLIYETITPMLNNVTTIIEPYCGTSAISYFISLKHHKKYRYILNDANKQLIELYELVRNPERLAIVEAEINGFVNNFNTYTDGDERKQYYLSVIKQDGLSAFLFKNKYYTIRPGMCPTMERAKELKPFKFSSVPIYEFIKNEDITFSTRDAIEVINQYKNDESALLILDPPYIATCNDLYTNKDMNIYEYLYNNDINNFTCPIVLILENMWINKLLFKRNKVSYPYEKTYAVSRKKTGHIIITKAAQLQ